MEWQIIGIAASPILLLVGYLHLRLNTVERGLLMSVSEKDVKDLVSLKLESIQLMQTLTDKRLDRLEEALDRLGEKIDQLISR